MVDGGGWLEIDINLPVHQRIKKYIKEQGLIIRSIAAKAGIKEDLLYDRLSGSVKMDPDELERLCIQGLGVNPSIFFAQKFSNLEKVECGN